ncbi:hypothetical protein DFLDMN_004288 [Cupriavidus sp. H19C3]
MDGVANHEARMTDISTVIAEIETADRHIADGRRLVRGQLALIRRLRADGMPTAAAEQLLQALRQTVTTLRGHRRHLCRYAARPSTGRAGADGSAPTAS